MRFFKHRKKASLDAEPVFPQPSQAMGRQAGQSGGLREMVVIRRGVALAVFLVILQAFPFQPDQRSQPLLGKVMRLVAGGGGDELPSVGNFLPERGQPQTGSLEVSIAGAPFMGSEQARVTMIEFSDYQCFFCRRHDRQVAPQLVREYVESGKVRYVFLDFPLASHSGASIAAQAAHCAGDQGKYWDMNDLLFRHPQALTPKSLRAFAGSLDLDSEVFLECVESGKHSERVRAGRNEGRRIGVRGTPSFFFGLTDAGRDRITVEETLTGAHPYPAFKSVIDDLLSR